jgi:hypothetical protein
MKMFKFNRLVCMLAVCAVVGVAFGAALKIKAITPVGDGVTENPDGDGMVIMNYHPGHDQTEITAAITDFVPDRDYKVSVIPGLTFSVTTNPAGNANDHGFFNGDICEYNEYGVTVVVWRDLNNDGFRALDLSEDRAEGFTPCP